MSKYHERYRKNRIAHGDIPNLISNVYMDFKYGFWCPERLEKHRSSRYHAEIVYAKELNIWIEFVVCTLKERTFCDYCSSLILVQAAERELLTEQLETRLLGLRIFEEEGEPFRVQRGVVTELYYGEEYDEFGRSISNNYLGHGSDLTEFQRVPYVDLEIIDVLKNILNDTENDPAVVFEKRRYIQSIVGHVQSLSDLSDKELVKKRYPDLDDFHHDLHGVSCCLTSALVRQI